jgi:putative tricarboxylic transport membrane protein
VRLNDTVIGSGLLLLSLAVLWHVQSFPAFPGQPYGPALFPGVVAGGLALASLLLIRDGLREGAPALGSGEGARRLSLPFATTVGCLFFYYFLSERLGFIVCATLMLVALFWTYGVRRALIAPIAMIAVMVIHTGFFKLLKVPLPWGVLQPLAW